MRRRRQSCEQQDGIVSLGIQFPPGFVGNARPVQHSAAPHRERIGQRREPARIKYRAGIAAGGVRGP